MIQQCHCMRNLPAPIALEPGTGLADEWCGNANASKSGDKVTIGENVYVGANASLDACTLDDNSFVGMGATISRGARVESFAVVSAGAVVQEGVTIPSGQIFAGAPAKYLRDLTQEEKHLMTEHKQELQQLVERGQLAAGRDEVLVELLAHLAHPLAEELRVVACLAQRE